MTFCSSSNESNILFAFSSQFGWQYESNRLFTNNTLTMSLDSWWAAANYYLSVILFLAAVDVGIIPHVSFPANSVEQWQNCFVQPKQLHKTIDETIIGDKMLDSLYLGPMWSAYITSINDALSLVESKTVFLPSNLERLFGYD
ncbi:unnamed protein product [Rotaria socialis]|uniref:Uncharacterized protein n=1 Tax=Rotaria socialis TaxID=392032 RepID=A0A820C2E1_9BILA|nr:unnamed protein product [Rotaria socialis]CAF4209601.1 unnamed protein product [Rotaria socialis]